MLLSTSMLTALVHSSNSANFGLKERKKNKLLTLLPQCEMNEITPLSAKVSVRNTREISFTSLCKTAYARKVALHNHKPCYCQSLLAFFISETKMCLQMYLLYVRHNMCKNFVSLHAIRFITRIKCIPTTFNTNVNCY
jgi:hypothetical protein